VLPYLLRRGELSVRVPTATAEGERDAMGDKLCRIENIRSFNAPGHTTLAAHDLRARLNGSRYWRLGHQKYSGLQREFCGYLSAPRAAGYVYDNITGCPLFLPLVRCRGPPSFF